MEESIGVLCTVTNPPCLSGPPSHPLQGCPSEMVHRAPRGGGQQPQRDTRRGAGARRADPTGQHPGTSLIAVLQLPGSQMPPFNPPPRSVDSALTPSRLWDRQAVGLGGTPRLSGLAALHGPHPWHPGGHGSQRPEDGRPCAAPGTQPSALRSLPLPDFFPSLSLKETEAAGGRHPPGREEKEDALSSQVQATELGSEPRKRPGTEAGRLRWAAGCYFCISLWFA